MKRLLMIATLVLHGAIFAAEPAPKKAKQGQDGVIGDAVELGVNKLASAVDGVVKAEKEREKAIPCPKRKVTGLMAGLSEDMARANSIKIIDDGQKVDFEDGSVWTASRRLQSNPRGRAFEMYTVEYEKPTEVFGVALWNARMHERWRQGVNNKKKTCAGLKTTFRKRDREFTPYGYVAIAGAAIISLKLLWKALS
jgi:hypothetical protein